jgi:hypothetical protein
VLAKNDEGDDEKGTDLSRFSTSALLFVFNWLFSSLTFNHDT